MRISIAIAAFKGEKFIASQVESIISQSLIPWEVVITDDSPDDETFKTVQKIDFKGIKWKYYRNEYQLGPVANFKKAITMCSGDLIALADQDDVWDPNKLAVLTKQFTGIDNDLPTIAFSDLKLIDSSGKTISESFFRRNKISPQTFLFEHLLYENFLMGCSMIINQAMRLEVLQMPEDIIMHDYWIALIAYSFGNYIYVDEQLMSYRSHDDTVTNKIQPSSFLKKFLKEVGESRKYLSANIDQAKKFSKIYFDKFEKADSETIQRFLSLETKSFLSKRLKAKSIKNKEQ